MSALYPFIHLTWKTSKGITFVALLSVFLCLLFILCVFVFFPLPSSPFVSSHQFAFAIHSHKSTLKLISRSLSVVYNIPIIFILLIACSGIGKLDWVFMRSTVLYQCVCRNCQLSNRKYPFVFLFYLKNWSFFWSEIQWVSFD